MVSSVFSVQVSVYLVNVMDLFMLEGQESLTFNEMSCVHVIDK